MSIMWSKGWLRSASRKTNGAGGVKSISKVRSKGSLLYKLSEGLKLGNL